MSHKMKKHSRLSCEMLTAVIGNLMADIYIKHLSADEYRQYLDTMLHAGEIIVAESKKKLLELAEGDAIGATL